MIKINATGLDEVISIQSVGLNLFSPSAFIQNIDSTNITLNKFHNHKSHVKNRWRKITTIQPKKSTKISYLSLCNPSKTQSQRLPIQKFHAKNNQHSSHARAKKEPKVNTTKVLQFHRCNNNVLSDEIFPLQILPLIVCRVPRPRRHQKVKVGKVFVWMVCPG